MNASDNPIRLVYTALWDMLEASSAFMSVVSGTGNRIRRDSGTRMFSKDALSDADVPQVELFLAGHEPHLERTTIDSFLDTVWEIRVATGDTQFESTLDTAWVIYRAMLGWQDKLLTALTWQGKTFVHLARPLLIEEKLDDNPRTPGNRGWTTAWRGEVKMHFLTSDVAD